MECEKGDMMKVSKDGRPWDTWRTSSRKGLQGVRRITDCRGSFTCTNPFCSMAGGRTNQAHFKKGQSGIKQCSLCDEAVLRRPCPAVKVWEYQDQLTVMYNGTHTCQAKVKRVTDQEIRKVIQENPSMPASKLIVNKMTQMMTSEGGAVPWADIINVAEKFVDVKEVHNQKARMKGEKLPHGHNFDAVTDFKRHCDVKDPYYIFKLNNAHMNNGLPTFVYKSSLFLGRQMADLDRTKPGLLRHTYVHMDTKHDKVRGMKSVTAWYEHPLYKKMICLAVMDVDQEDTEALKTFWKTSNELVSEVTGDATRIFDPVGLCVDENPANWKSIREVYGDDALKRTVSCEFHFKQSLQKHSTKLPPTERTNFISLGTALMEATTIPQYFEVRDKIEAFIVNNDGLKPWFKWWHDRRQHVMRCYKPLGAPAANKAEIGHAKMANINPGNRLLIEACRDDVAGEMLYIFCKMIDHTIFSLFQRPSAQKQQ